MSIQNTRPARSSRLRADCSKCCALCCVAPAFDAVQGFGFDKPAHVPCGYLRGGSRCAIHGELERRGFPACAGFDCHGAGQRVTQQLFGGKSWQSSPDIAPSMFNAYLSYRALHELLVLLETAIERVTPSGAHRLMALYESVDELCDSGAALHENVRLGEVRREVLAGIHDALQPGIRQPTRIMNPSWAIGLMTGTVLDGMVDVAAIRTDGVEIHELGPWRLIPYPAELRRLLAETVAAALEWQFAGPEPAIFRRAEEALTRAQTDAVGTFLADSGIAAGDIAVVGFHGQTVLHRPPEPGRPGNTRQLGDGEWMARTLGIRVAYDFRSADMQAGGQGAPLAATYHPALLRFVGAPPDSAVLNLGGVGNITWWGGGDEIIAFDTGPANAPLNDWIGRHGLGDMDRGGALAMQGRVDEARLAAVLQNPFFAKRPPKSLDRHGFSASEVAGLSAADGAATLTALVGASVGKALDSLPRRPAQLIVCGGGRKNPAILEAIRTRARIEPVPAEAVGWRGDAIEAECFAHLAVRTLRGLPITFPLTTGVAAPLTGGRLARPKLTQDATSSRAS